MTPLAVPSTFICGYCDCSEFGVWKTSPSRTVQIFEVEYYLENGRECYLNGRELPVKADHILIARPGDIRYSHLPFKTAFLKFPAEGALAEALTNASSYFPAVHPGQIREQLHEIILLSETKKTNVFCLGGKFLSLLSLILDDSRCPPFPPGVNQALMCKAKRYLEQHFGDRITTTEVADRIGLSESRLRVLFSSVYGISPHRYLTDIRIAAAKEMLWNTAVPLTEIAEKCGFGSQQYLTDTFKKQVGLSPGKYRVRFARKYTEEVAEQSAETTA